MAKAIRQGQNHKRELLEQTARVNRNSYQGVQFALKSRQEIGKNINALNWIARIRMFEFSAFCTFYVKSKLYTIIFPAVIVEMILLLVVAYIVTANVTRTPCTVTLKGMAPTALTYS
jgi:hypothetical protein